MTPQAQLPDANSKRLSCPVCHRVVLALPGSSQVKALENHLEHDHWYTSREAASEAASVK
jgi:hypothetical protein